jgi:hypothetical protein
MPPLIPRRATMKDFAVFVDNRIRKILFSNLDFHCYWYCAFSNPQKLGPEKRAASGSYKSLPS